MKISDGQWHLEADGGRPDCKMDIDADGMGGETTWDSWDYDSNADAYVAQRSDVIIVFTEKDPPENGPPPKLDFAAVWNAGEPNEERFTGTATKV